MVIFGTVVQFDGGQNAHRHAFRRVSGGEHGAVHDACAADASLLTEEIAGKRMAGLLFPLIAHSSNLNELWCWKSPRVSEDPPSHSIHNSSSLLQTTACGLIMI